jgi:hypothetical protein
VKAVGCLIREPPILLGPLRHELLQLPDALGALRIEWSLWEEETTHFQVRRTMFFAPLRKEIERLVAPERRDPPARVQ